MKPITFRPTEDSLKALEAIKQARGCNQSQAINMALILEAGVGDGYKALSPTKLTRKAPKQGWKA